MVAKLLIGCVVAVAAVGVGVGAMVAAGSERSAHGSVLIRPCGLRLPPAAAGLPAFAVPAGGRAVVRLIPDQMRQCRLVRADGSMFALAEIDRHGDVDEMNFFRPSGRLLFDTDAADAATTARDATRVRCGSGAYTTLGHGFWHSVIKWRAGKTPSYLPRDKVISALREAQSEWNNNLNWCNLPDHSNSSALYQGSTSSGLGRNGVNSVDWGGGINLIQGCSGAYTIACAVTWYSSDGTPVESDVRFSTRVRWSTSGAPDAYDIQSLGAHEFGHVRQFGHADRPNQNTLVMWPFFSVGNTSARKLGRGDSLADNHHY